MALTVDQLLAAETSSDEDAPTISAPAAPPAPAPDVAAALAPEVVKAPEPQAVAATGGSGFPGKEALDALADLSSPGLEAAKPTAPPAPAAAPAASAPRPKPAATPAVAPPPRKALTVEEALAQGESEDEEDDEDVQPAGAKPVSNVPSASRNRSATVGTDDTDLMSDDARPVAGAAVGLDEILAMADSSDDEAMPLAGGAVAVGTQAAAAAIAQATTGANQAQLAEGHRIDQEEDNLVAFAEAPFGWCLEHERRMLLHNVEDPMANLGGSDGVPSISSFNMVIAQPCMELRRMLAKDFGLPTCVFAHSKYIGVGSLRGGVVLLDPKTRDVPPSPQVFSPPGNDDGVAVTAGAISPDGSSMLVGHKNGQIVLWDLNTGKVAVVVKEVHTSTVLALAFARSNWQYALSSDANGKLFLLTFTSTLGRKGCQSTLLLEQSSNIGITLRILPLPHNPANTGRATDTQCLVALCATNATVLLTLHPSVHVLQKMQYHTKDANTSWVPDAAWLCGGEYSDSLQPSDAAADPLLCIGYGQSIHLMRVSYSKQSAAMKDEFKISPLRKYAWSSPIRSIVPLNESMIAILDSANKLNFIQLPNFAESSKPNSPEMQLVSVHVEDVSSWSLAYHTQTSVDSTSDARSHHSALAVFKGKSRTLYVCCMQDVRSLRVDRWGRQIEELVAKNDWSGALNILIALRRGSLPSLLDFPHDSAGRQRAVETRTTQVIQSYLVSRLQPDMARPKVREICGTAVTACVDMCLWSVLYKTVFECFKATGHVNVYCSVLEPFIVKGRIPRGQMDSEVLSSILQSYAVPLEVEGQTAEQTMKDTIEVAAAGAEPLLIDCDHYPQLFPMACRLQQLVLYVEVAQLDLNLAIRLFTQHRLWTALVHVYCSLGDYASPVELLVGECNQLVKRGYGASLGEAQAEKPLLKCLLVRKLFFFLHRCFDLRCFPLDSKECPGMVHPGPHTIAELLKCIFKLEPPLFLRLLRISPLGFFSALASLFASPSASHALQSPVIAEGPPFLGQQFHPLSLKTLFGAIEAAFEVARQRAVDDGVPLPSNTESEFLWFVARAVPRAKVDLPRERCLSVMDHILTARQAEAATGVPPFGCHAPEEAQQLLIGLLASQEPFSDKNERDVFIGKAIRQSFFRVASWLHERHGEFDRALDCRMQDHKLQEDIFEYIISRLAEKPDEKAALVEATLQRLPRLVTLDAERCAVMICEQFTNVADHGDVLQRLRAYPQIEQQYLETLLVQRKGSHWRSSEDQQAFFDTNVVRYVELLCLHAPTAVLPFINANEALPLRECLELCRRHSVTDASINLLERTGDFPSVLALLLNDYGTALEHMHGTFIETKPQDRAAVAKVIKRLVALGEEKAYISGSKDALDAPWYDGLQDAQRTVDLIEQAFELSARNSNIMTESQLEDLWFGVLARTIQWQEQIMSGPRPTKRHTGLATALDQLSDQAMTGILAYLSLPRSLKRICAEFKDSTLAIWKGPLEGILSGLNYQGDLLCAAKAVAAQDVVKPFETVKRRGSRGIPMSPQGRGPASVRFA